MSDCVFCAIACGEAPEPEWFVRRDDIMVFEPLNPFTPGHVLFVPIEHVESMADAEPKLVRHVMTAVAGFVHGWRDASGHGANVITSIGVEATQTVMHWHVHVVPRRVDDDLSGWPWKDRSKVDTGIQVHIDHRSRQPEGYGSGHLQAAFEEGLRRGRAGY